jgi:hypothetical protein
VAASERLTPERARIRLETIEPRLSIRRVAAAAGLPHARLHRWLHGRSQLSSAEVDAVRLAIDRPDGASLLNPGALALSRVVTGARETSRRLTIAMIDTQSSAIETRRAIADLAREHASWVDRVEQLASACIHEPKEVSTP